MLIYKNIQNFKYGDQNAIIRIFGQIELNYLRFVEYGCQHEESQKKHCDVHHWSQIYVKI